MTKEETKYCGRCDDTKSLEEFGNLSTTSDGKQPYCKECKSKSAIKYNRSPKGRKARSEAGKKRRQQPGYAVKHNAYQAKYNRTKKGLAYKKKQRKDGTENLRNWYVYHCLKANGLTREEITPKLIETKRANLQLHRTL